MSQSQVEGDKAVHAKMVHEVAATTLSHNQVLTVTPGEPFGDVGAVNAASRPVPSPNDFLPEAPDLPEMGADLFTEVPGGSGTKYWEYACVLIALFKADGVAKVREVTGNKNVPDNLVKAVHALHDHYIRDGVQYDDGSVRSRVMSDWGYHRVFAGLAHWDQLPEHVGLTRGPYIFDIKGHTVKVNVLQDISAATRIDRRDQYFAPDSDSNNYTRGQEFTKQVTAIWKKS